MKLSRGTGANSLTPEQRDTAKLIDQLLGKALADRYIDFCRLSAGDFDLRVGIPMAGHSLREFDSILRAALATPLDAKIETGLGKAQLKDIETSLKGLGYDDNAINRAKAALAPRVNHVGQIKKIVARLGLDPDGDVAKNWLGVREAAAKAHERTFNRTLGIDDTFRENWAKPFESVIRSVVVALQGHYSAFAKRVETLAAMEDTAKAVELFATEIPGAMSLQWMFFRSIQGGRWLPELIKRDLIVPPQVRDQDDYDGGVRFREWPVGAYLVAVAKTGNEVERALVAKALRNLRSSEHPDLRRDGLEVMAALPGNEAAPLSDVAESWLMADYSLVFGGYFAEALLKNVAETGNREATLRIAKAMLRLFSKDGDLRSHYSHHMYEHSLPKTAKILTKAVGLDALRLLVDLLYEAGVLDGKIRVEPPADYTSAIIAPLTSAENVHDIFGALVATVGATAIELIQAPGAPVEEIIAILLKYSQKVFRRIVYAVLAHNAQAAPQLSDKLLLNGDAMDSFSLRFEYGELAKARFPHMTAGQQTELLCLVDALPAKHEAMWRQRFEEHEKRPPDENNARVYRMAVVRDALWEWRDVLPEERKKTLATIVAEIQDPDAWKRRFEAGDQSPMSAEDFKNRSAEEVAEYLRSWQPDQQNHETKTALAFELYKAVQADTEKFAAGAMAFKELAPIYVRRFFEGLRHPTQNKARFPWSEPLQLVEQVMPLVQPQSPGEMSSGGDDPSWFWAGVEGAQLLRAGLQRGRDGTEYENAPLVAQLIEAIDKAAPPTPEGDKFEQSYQKNPYFAAENTMLGLAVELRILELFWLSKQEGSFVAKSPKEAIKNSPGFVAFATRVLAMDSANGRVVHAIFGRYLDWLYYFGEDWIKANLKLIFPDVKPLRDAAWLGHLINGGGPILPLMPQMQEVYAEETEHLLVPRADNEREWRQDRFGEYILLQYLVGDYPGALLDRFFVVAPARLRQHVMWFLGRQLRRAGVPESSTERGMAYWEARLAVAEQADDKEPFSTELASIGSWLRDSDLDHKWLIQQMLRMLRAGFAPSQAYSVVEYAAKIADAEAANAVDLIGELFKHPQTDQWAYMTQNEHVRKVLEAGIVTGDAAVQANVERVISFLVSHGETGYLDLSARGKPTS